MTNSIFIHILKVIRASKVTDIAAITNLINEYIDWCMLSQEKYKKNYGNYINSLQEILKLVQNNTTLEDIYGYIADLISMYYIMTDEGDVW